MYWFLITNEKLNVGLKEDIYIQDDRLAPGTDLFNYSQVNFKDTCWFNIWPVMKGVVVSGALQSFELA